MFLEINENFVKKNLSSNIINKKEDIEYLTKGVVEIIKENLLKDEDFK